MDNQVFQPITDWNDRFLKMAERESATTASVAYVRNGECVRLFKTPISTDEKTWDEREVPRYLRTYIYNRAWGIGAPQILINCPGKLYEQIRIAFMEEEGEFHHLSSFMAQVYENPFEILWAQREEIEKIPAAQTSLMRCSPKKDARIGVDLGGTDIKVVALLDGELRFHEKRNWNPKTFTDAEEHLTIVSDMISKAKEEGGLATLDGIGISTAGVVLNSRVMISGLCAGLTEDQFRNKITPMGEIISARFSRVEVNLAHDGDVAALWAYLEMGLGNVLGLALGTGLGAGFADKDGSLTGFLCETGKSLLDMSPDAPEHIYNHTRGPALHYLSQNAVFRLAKENNIEIDHIEERAEKLKYVQNLAEDGNPIAREIFEMIGDYLAVAVVEFYDYFGMQHVVLFGRVTSGIAGEILFNRAKQVLQAKFPDVTLKVQLHLPTSDDTDTDLNREFGQAIAAAYLSS